MCQAVASIERLSSSPRDKCDAVRERRTPIRVALKQRLDSIDLYRQPLFGLFLAHHTKSNVDRYAAMFLVDDQSAIPIDPDTGRSRGCASVPFGLVPVADRGITAPVPVTGSASDAHFGNSASDMRWRDYWRSTFDLDGLIMVI
jgi:hypothetical protein